MNMKNPAGRAGRTAAFALSGLLAMAVIYTLHTAADILVPIMLATFLGLLFFPLVRKLAKMGIPSFITAGLVIATLLTAAWLSVSFMAKPAEAWLKDAPRSIRQLREQSLQTDQKIEDIKQLAEEVDELTEVEDTNDRSKPQPVTIKQPGLFEELVGGLPTLVAQAVIVVFLTFFLLVTADTFLLKIVRCGKTWAQRRKIVVIARSIQRELSRYLGLITLINIGLGAATAGFLHAMDVPRAIMWGAIVALFNFAPYLGAVTSTFLLMVVGLTTFPTPAEALVIPAGFLVLTTLEGQIITPTLVGRNMSINPTVVLLSVIFWGWMWGIAGALMAVPLLTCFKVFCDRYPPMQFVGSFLSSNR